MLVKKSWGMIFVVMLGFTTSTFADEPIAKEDTTPPAAEGPLPAERTPLINSATVPRVPAPVITNTLPRQPTVPTGMPQQPVIPGASGPGQAPAPYNAAAPQQMMQQGIPSPATVTAPASATGIAPAAAPGTAVPAASGSTPLTPPPGAILPQPAPPGTPQYVPPANPQPAAPTAMPAQPSAY